MSLHVVVGAGPVGSAIARLLAARGEQVRLITRTGAGPQPTPTGHEASAREGGMAADRREATRRGAAPDGRGPGRGAAPDGRGPGRGAAPDGRGPGRGVAPDGRGEGGRGMAPDGRGADVGGFGADPGQGGPNAGGFGADPGGFGAGARGVGADPRQVRSDPGGFGAGARGVGAEPRQVRSDPGGFGAGARGVGADPRQVGADAGEVGARGVEAGVGGVECVAADAGDGEGLGRLVEGAVALYSCAGPAYHRWASDWPALGAGLIRAAESSGAVLVTTGNLYGYGAVDGAMTEELPLRANSVKGRVRARLWEDALAAHEAGRIRTAEVRGSDYLGALTVSPFSVMVLPKVIAGSRGMVPADLDAPHSWTYVGDVARTLVAVAADDKAWGRPWHVPTPPPLSIRELAGRAAELAGAPAARVAKMPGVVLRLAGLFNPAAREMVETQYQWQRPFVLDSKAATVAFGIEPTPTDEALRETINALRAAEAAV